MYGIRPKNGHIGDRMNQHRGDFSSVRVGAYGIRPMNGHIGGRMNRNYDVFFVCRRSGKGWLGGCGLLLSIDIVRKGIRGLGNMGRD